jgi:hypothetical protein
MAQLTENYTIKQDGYLTFDAMSLRQLIVNRLNEQKVFVDQNYIGSNLASIIDIVAYAYNTLIYYLNQTASESMFTEAQLYENINRIVKLIDYKPIGFQTSTLSFQSSALNLSQGVYTIPRYSRVLIGNIPFSFNEDITFKKNFSNQTEPLSEISRKKLLYQGTYEEYPIYTAAGEDNEVVFLNVENEYVDHFNIDVYVRSGNTQQWEQFTSTPNLFLENGFAKKYEIRLNSNKRYEIRFGNDINGYRLKQGDLVSIYYLRSSGSDGVVGGDYFNNYVYTVYPFKSIQYDEIISPYINQQYRILTPNELAEIKIANTLGSTPVKDAENVEDIRQNAPKTFNNQYRLVTNNDYENYIKSNFSYILSDVRVINNQQYASQYLKYYYEKGLQDPLKTERPLINQILYSDSCNFNNVYVICVPRSTLQTLDYLVPAQKELIRSAIDSNKITTTETILIDPIYKAVGFGVLPGIILPEFANYTQQQVTTELLAFDPDTDSQLCGLEIKQRSTSRRDQQAIINDVVNVFSFYFSRDSLKLGQVLDVRTLTQELLSIDGIETFYTKRLDVNDVKVEGLSFFVWNPLYPYNDKIVTSNNVLLNEFEFPYFDNLRDIASKITVI